MSGKTNIKGMDKQILSDMVNWKKLFLSIPFLIMNIDKKLQMPDFSVSAYGENLAVKNIDEDDLCISDIFHIGEAIVQVSQPRQPCWRPARRWKVKKLALQIQQEDLTGWYFRVLKEG